MNANIRPVLDLAYLYNETLFRSSSYPVQMWIAEGCDLEKDILPTLKEVIDRRHKGRFVSKIDNFRYFTNAVYDARERRLAEQRAQERKQAAPPTDIHQRAKMAATTVRKFGIQDAVAKRFLSEYEATHGPVQL